MRCGTFAGAAAAAAVLGSLLVTGPARAATEPGDEMRLNFVLSIGGTPIADFQQEFGAAGAGWRYLYNAGGPLGNVANNAPLTLANGQYADPTGRVVVGRRPIDASDVVAYPPSAPFFPAYPETFVRPGAGYSEDPAGVERAAIIEYTIQPNDLPAGTTGPAEVFITAYDFAVSALATPTDLGMSARVYGRNNPAPLLEFSDQTFPFPPGFRFETVLDPAPKSLQTYSVGDTIVFAIGANSMSVVPEPGSVAVFAPAALLLMRRRRQS